MSKGYASFDQTQPVKVDGTATSETEPLAVRLTDGTDWYKAGGGSGGSVEVSNFPATQPVSGTVAVSNLPVTQPVSGTVAVSNLPVTQPVSGPLTDTQLRAGAVPVSGTFFQTTQPVSGTVAVSNFPGTVAVSNLPATQPVSGNVAVSNLPVTQAVSGPLTDTQLRATAVPVSGTFFQTTQPVSGTFFQATQPVSGTVAVSNFPATLTDTQLRATAVPVSGTFFQATQPVSGTVAVSNFPATQPVSAASLPLPSGAATLAKQPALGTAGTPSADVLTVQGATSMTALKVDGSGVTQPVTFSSADGTASGALGVANAAVSIALVGKRGAGMQLSGGNLSAILIPEVSFDGGTTWATSAFIGLPTTAPVVFNLGMSPSPQPQLSVTGGATYLRTIHTPAGVSHCRVRVGTYTSGSSTCALRSTDVAPPDLSIVAVNNPLNLAGAGTPAAGVVLAGYDTANSTFNYANIRPGIIVGQTTAANSNDNALIIGHHPDHPLPAARVAASTNSPLGSISLGNSLKTVQMKTNTLVTTAVTADQVVLTYSITAGTTFYLQYLEVDCRLTTFATTVTLFGTFSFESPSGTKNITATLAGAGADRFLLALTEPIPFATLVRVVCTPSAVTSFTWRANFGGYEK